MAFRITERRRATSLVHFLCLCSTPPIIQGRYFDTFPFHASRPRSFPANRLTRDAVKKKKNVHYEGQPHHVQDAFPFVMGQGNLARHRPRPLALPPASTASRWRRLLTVKDIALSTGTGLLVQSVVHIWFEGFFVGMMTECSST